MNKTALFLYFKNSSWMLLEQILKLISGVFVGIYVARYLGPQNFGEISYALAIVTIVMAITRLGMDSIFVREVSTKKEEESFNYLFTAFVLMMIAGVVGFLCVYIVVYANYGFSNAGIYVALISMAILFQPLSVVDYYFQSKLAAKYSSIAKVTASLAGVVFKVWLVFIDASLVYFALSYAFDFLVLGVFLTGIFLRKNGNFFNLIFFDRSLIRPLLNSCWPMTLSTLGVVLYMKIDQVMINHILGAEQLGVYAAASKLYEGWLMLPYVLSISILPVLTKIKISDKKRFNYVLTLCFSVFVWGGVFVALISTLFSDFFIRLTFGALYKESAIIFSILMWSSVFSGLNTVITRYLTIERLEKIVVYKVVSAIILNVLLNLLIIPLMGCVGASLATFVTTIYVCFFSNYFFSELKPLRIMLFNSLFFRFKNDCY